ncbi:hypothetical protein CERSUDRAFT_112276 [Gelatoporia subvermispora B]|uniref:Mitochondrial K+-H+ exchange-related-domain-containing protein n=1 Tax=Ceriporiopsis subvermispora (strain B) TaxID=914234 RepID=M2PTL8_CERS8|nr:hypothetical protein CERSUDRAFT_112276 [Gelatoporia subvermispora B]
MSVLPRATRTMRIIALPLAPAATNASASASAVPAHLTYYHFVTPPPSPQHKRNNWGKWVTTKAAGLWAGLGKAPEGNWKRRAFLYGERLIDRLDFEELALKSVDPSLGPSLRFSDAGKLRPADHPQIPLIYPASLCTTPLPHLRALLEKRTPRHRKGFLAWLAIAPFTAPFMLIPIIPNFPFFFCAWRSWSHYRAWKASQYLEQFVEQGAIVPEPSPELDEIYAEYAPRPPLPSTASSPSSPSAPSSRSPSNPSTPEPEHDPSAPPPSASASAPPYLLLSRHAIPALSRALNLPSDASFAADVLRALEQARIRLGIPAAVEEPAEEAVCAEKTRS